MKVNKQKQKYYENENDLISFHMKTISKSCTNIYIEQIIIRPRTTAKERAQKTGLTLRYRNKTK